ncbi:type II toxin-antitoxin system HicB family antitoxin [Nitratidesulfovibrio sp. SRB-5]|uniref:type II toxin-antitoxin system HicB family antitoxin n=1 Tax=Nitratidesulfovibrio sp. SRB-5 TaxID=2872636 RepID=UPI001025387D|nr:type II toxin-antitoxin system HicB family antitoxin [Nitratidesulfovibrio sp. SRB-5]MBZ2172209.1 type II toxin-antitoxin system HicB family antitoxin [Nitratidesulfovibrio sp. SRB-5]RXF77400.1 type II toxin-antitoxin system HicB family antitoxin [Desulfovibrio sp. DS-1]
MHCTIEVEREEDGRWLAEVMELPGVMPYSPSAEMAATKAFALRAIADRLEYGDSVPGIEQITFSTSNEPLALR